MPVTNLKWLKNYFLIAPAHFFSHKTTACSQCRRTRSHAAAASFKSRNTFLRTCVTHQYRFRRAPRESVVDQRPYTEERKRFQREEWSLIELFHLVKCTRLGLTAEGQGGCEKWMETCNTLLKQFLSFLLTQVAYLFWNAELNSGGLRPEMDSTQVQCRRQC